MGVFGLSTYLHQNRKQLLERHRLRQCSLVIDGNNLMYYLAAECASAFGGEYYKFAECVRKFFRDLAQCLVKAYVVLDGSTKLKLHRLRDRVRSFMGLRPGRTVRGLGVLTRFVFVRILEEMNVPYVQCEEEADREVASLAIQLHCPVLTNDSDLCIFNIDVILLDCLRGIQRDNEDKSKKWLQCLIHKATKLVQHFRLIDANVLPLIVTIVGNDQIPRRLTRRLYRNLPKRNMPNMKPSLRRIVGLFTCFQHCDFQSAVQKVLKFERKQNRRKLAATIKKSLEFYTPRQSILAPFLGLPLVEQPDMCPEIDDVEEDNEENIHVDLVELNTDSEDDSCNIDSSVSDNVDSADSDVDEGHPTVHQKPDVDAETEEIVSSETPFGDDKSLVNTDVQKPWEAVELPNWMLVELHKHNLPSLVIDIARKGYLILETQVEAIWLPTAYKPSWPILSVICGLILGKDDDVITCFVRFRRKLRTLQLIPIISLPCYSKFPDLEMLRSENLQSRQQLFETALDMNMSELEVVHRFPEKLQILACSLFYWIRNAEPAVNEYHVAAILLSIVCFHINKSAIYTEWEKFLDKCSLHYYSPAELKTFRKVLDRFNRYYSFYDFGILHSYAQFQAIYRSAIDLSSLLGYPYAYSNDVFSIFSGIFFYNVVCELQHRDNPPAYIDFLLKSGTATHHLYRSLFQAVITVVNLEPMKIAVSKKSLKRRRAQRNKKLVEE